MTITGNDDDIHPRGEGDHYLENYLFAGMADESDIGFYVHLSRMFEIQTMEVHAAVFEGADAVTCLERHDVDESSMRTATFDYDVIEPMREWRLRYDGVGRPGAFIDDPARGVRDLRFDIRFRARLEPADMAEAFQRAGFGGIGGNHYEQGFEWEGEITVGGRTVKERGLGLRDHSWGKRHMTEHNTTWWFPSVSPRSSVFYTGLEIRRGEKRMGASTHSDENGGTRLLDDLGVTLLAGDQVTYSRASLMYGDEEPAVAQGVCRIPMPWLIGQGLPRLSDDLFCRVQMPDGSRGFGLVEMSRAATEAEQAGFGAMIDTRSTASRHAAGDGSGKPDQRNVVPRVRGLAASFPIDWSQFYTRTHPGHVEHVVVASVLADLVDGPAVDQEAVAGYRSVLAAYRDAVSESGCLDLVSRIDAVTRQQVERGVVEVLVGDVMRALPLGSGTEAADEAWERLHRAAVEVDARAHEARTDARRRHLPVEGPAESQESPEAPEGRTKDMDDTLKAIDAGVADHFSLPRGEVAGRVLSGGLSKVTLAYDLPDASVVVRADRGAQYSGAPVRDEYATISAAHAAGVPAPAPITFIEASADRPAFSVVLRAEGNPLPGFPRFKDEAMCRRLAEILAAVHRIPLDSAPHLHGAGDAIVDRVLADLDARMAQWRASGCATPLNEFGAQWLRAHVHDGDGPRVVVHGDYRPHNMLGVDRRITAVLDWEHSKVGNAVEDLAYVRPTAEALASWDLFVEAYVAAGGRRPSERELRFYEVSGALFNSTILDQMELEFDADPSRPLAMIATVLQARPVMRAQMLHGLGFGAQGAPT